MSTPAHYRPVPGRSSLTGLPESSVISVSSVAHCRLFATEITEGTERPRRSPRMSPLRECGPAGSISMSAARGLHSGEVFGALIVPDRTWVGATVPVNVNILSGVWIRYRANQVH